MFPDLESISRRPEPFEFYTAKELWTDEHLSEQMLRLHLDETNDISSRSAGFMDRSVEWIVSRFEVSPETRIIDFGCGPGLYTSRLARHGARVTGIDFSTRSIQYASQEASEKGLAIHYENRDYLEFDTDERFDLAIMISCDFCALGPSQRRRMLETFSKILEPGGRLLLDVYSLVTFAQRTEAAGYELSSGGGFWSPHRHYEFRNTFKYGKERVVLDKYTIVEADRLRTIYNWFQCFDPHGIERELAASGLQIEQLYGDVAGSPFNAEANEFAVVARKPI